jgi:hypothetical protein
MVSNCGADQLSSDLHYRELPSKTVHQNGDTAAMNSAIPLEIAELIKPWDMTNRHRPALRAALAFFRSLTLARTAPSPARSQGSRGAMVRVCRCRPPPTTCAKC